MASVGPASSPTHFELLSQAAAAIIEYRTSKKSELITTISSVLKSWNALINETKGVTKQSLTLSSKEKLKDYEAIFRKFIKEEVGAKAAVGIINEAILLCEELVPPLNYNELSRPELLSVFYDKESLSDLFAWGQNCPKTSEIVTDLQAWQESPLFSKLLSANRPSAHRAEFSGFLTAAYESTDSKIKKLGSHLATRFFNETDDETLANFVSSCAPDEKRAFLMQLNASELSRTSIKLWPKYFAENEERLQPEWLLSHLPMCERLNLQGASELTDDHLTALSHFQNLKVILFQSSPITVKTLERLANSCPRLTRIELDSCRNLSGPDLQHLGRFRELSHLSVKSNDTLSDDHLSFLQVLTKLQSLELTFLRGIQGSFVTYLPHLAELHTLRLSGTEIVDGAIVKVIKKVPSLRELELLDCSKLSGEVLAAIRQCLALQKLFCSGWKAVTDAQFQTLGGLEKLEVLHMNSANGFTGAALAQTRLPALTEFYLVDCPTLQEPHLASLGQAMPALTKLNLSKNPSITSLAFVKPLGRLLELHLRNCSQLTDRNFDPIAQLASQLQVLSLSQNRLSDAVANGIKDLADLRRLEMMRSANLSNGFLEAISSMSKLQFLDVTLNRNLTLDAIQYLQQRNPTLTILHSVR